MSIIKKIVLTGGPCGGKTTCKSRSLETLLKAGCIPIFVSETATDMKVSGIDPVKNVISSYNFQLLLSKLQIAKEDNIISILEKEDRDFVLIFDRGLLDSKVYAGKDWKRILNELDITEADIYKRYDVIFHLVSAACGAEDFYTLENNNVRSEGIEDARLLEEKTKEAYYGFPYIYYFGNETNFDDKMNNVISKMLSCIGKATPIFGAQNKFLVKKVNYEKLNKLYPQEVNIIQHYLNSSNCDYELRIRKLELYGSQIYYYTEKDNKRFITTEEIITKKEYDKLLNLKENIIGKIKKKRWYFSFNNLYYQYDEFEFDDLEYGILEVQITNKQSVIEIPECFREEVYDITCYSKLTNYSISQSVNILDFVNDVKNNCKKIF